MAKMQQIFSRGGQMRKKIRQKADKARSAALKVPKAVKAFSVRTADRLSKAASKRGLRVSELREYSKYVLVSLLSFLMAYARFPQDIRPLGIAVICAAADKKTALFAYIGCAVACVTYPDIAIAYFIVYFMLFAARKAFTDSKFREPIYVKVIESTAASMAIGVIRISSSHSEALYEYIAALASAALAAAFTYFFSNIFARDIYDSIPLGRKSICSYALMGAIVCSLSGIGIFGFDLRLIAACVITLTYAVSNGFMHAGIVGFVCGVACGDPMTCACLGLCGLISGLLFPKSIFAALFSFAAVFFTCGAYSQDIQSALALMPSVALACLIFIPACAFLPDIMRISVSAKGAKANTDTADKSNYPRRLSEAFFSLSEVFYKLSENRRFPSESDTGIALERAFSEVCSKCALNEMCFARRNTDEDELRKKLHSAMQVRQAEPDDFGANMKEKCIRLEALCDEVNASYRKTAVALSKDNRTSLLSSQYAGIARLITDTEKKSAEISGRDEAYEKKIADALKKIDMPFSRITVCSKREKKVKIYGVNLDKIPFGAEELKKYMLTECGLRITEPSFDMTESSGIVMSFERAPVISVEYSHASKSKEDDEVNGDTVNFVHGDHSFFHAFICDGMGSGADAALASRLSSVFLEKTLSVGAKKSIILELLNNALLAQSNESFSTVDLLEADLLTGKSYFLKAGAAPTFILRRQKLYKISSATVPVGIISSFTAESTRFDLEAGDVIIMVSDGVVQGTDESPWLAELIRMDVTRDPSVLSRKILDKAREINVRTDDMTAAVIKIKGC